MLDEESKESVISKTSAIQLTPKPISPIDQFVSRVYKDDKLT